MADEIGASRAAIASSRALILASVPAADRDGPGAELLDDVDKKLQSAAVAITTQARRPARQPLRQPHLSRTPCAP